MIERIDHTNPSIAKTIRKVFQSSYAIEAALLKVELADFPPLLRTVEEVMQTQNYFYAYFAGGKIAAVTEVKINEESIHIQSMVVDPTFFRQGIAEKLIQFIFKSYPSLHYTVETGAANPPAIALYKKLGFVEVNKYLTREGIEKIRLQKMEIN